MRNPYQTRLFERIEELTSEHRELEMLIERVVADSVFDQLQVRRMKKRKLLLKDQLALLRRELDPDVRA